MRTALVTWRHGLCSLACVAWLVPHANAGALAPLQLRASYSLQSDSNLFRLPANSGIKSEEEIKASTLGLRFSSTQSLQQFEADVSLVNYQYKNFSYNNFTATNYSLAWKWSLTPRFTGTLSTTRRDTLNSFTDSANRNTRNERKDTESRLDAIYTVDGPWRLLAGVGKTEQINQEALVAGGDYRSNFAEGGIRHVFSSGSSLGYSARVSQGNYLNRTLPSAGFYDDSFRQVNNELRLRWSIDGSSSADFSLTHIQRSHPNYSQRDYNGFNSGASVNWVLTGKTALNLAYAHELSAYATSNSNYSQTDRITLAPTWQMSSTTTLSLQHAWARMSLLGSPSAGLSSQREDISRETSLRLNWQPYEQINLGATLQNVSRSSNQSSLDYDSTIAIFSAELDF